jgi:hypothetical protein
MFAKDETDVSDTFQGIGAHALPDSKVIASGMEEAAIVDDMETATVYEHGTGCQPTSPFIGKGHTERIALNRSDRRLGVQKNPDVSIGVKVGVMDFEVDVISEGCISYIKMVTYLTSLFPSVIFQCIDTEEGISVDTGS